MSAKKMKTGNLYKIVYTKQALKDKKKIIASPFKEKTRKLIEKLKVDPFVIPPPFERLVGDLTGFISRRINIQHRLVYQVYEKEKMVKIIRMWTHYEA